MAEEVAAGAGVESHNGGAAKATVTFSFFKPQIVVPAHKADEAVQFYKAAFGAEELKRVNHPKRKAEQELPYILCSELKIGSSFLLVCDLCDETEEGKVASNVDSGILFLLETGDVQAAVANAVKAGAAQVGEIVEEEGPCGGGLVGKVKDPFGHVWAISVAKKCGSTEPEA